MRLFMFGVVITILTFLSTICAEDRNDEFWFLARGFIFLLGVFFGALTAFETVGMLD